MAGEDPLLSIRADFEYTKAGIQQVQDELLRAAALARSVGDETLAAQLEMQKLAVPGPTSPTTGRGLAGRGGTGAAEQERLNTLKQAGVKVDAGDLEVLTQQTRALAEQAAIKTRLQSSGLITTPRRQGGSYSQLASQQVAADEQAAAMAAREQAAVARRGILLGGGAAATGGVLVPPTSTRGGSYDTLAAQQVAADEERIAAAAKVEAAERAQIAALQERQRVAAAEQLAIEQETLAVAREQRNQYAYQVGATAGGMTPTGRVAPRVQTALATAPAGINPEMWTAADMQAVRYNTTLGQNTALNARASLSTEALTTNLTRLGVADAQASNQLRKHGALTTEFLGALARGETTVSEFGFQIGATIGKFAGWTAAAAATYGALGAVFEVGKGAVEAATSVHQLTRTIDNVNPAQASNAIQGLSAETNVSMKEAGDAVFAFSRTFHDIPTATGAARLGVAALKLDNVALTDSVRASTAITTQFGGGLSTLTTVYNELSAAQREYNARISDMVPMLQVSSGAVHNAGGDLNQLIQLGAYAARITQQGGSRIGTGFYRSASNILSQASTQGQTNRAAVASLGVDVTGSFTQTLINAITRAQETGPKALTPVQRGALSVDIFGKQFGGRFSSLFNPSGADVFQGITGGGAKGINPAATKGSLDTELQKELGTAGQQFKSFIYELQRIGAAFAETGVITMLTNTVGGVVLVMDQFRRIVDVFDQLPGPIKEAVTAVLAFRAASLFFSRTRLGSTAPGITSIPGFRPSQATLARGTLAIGTRSAITGVEADLAATSAQVTKVGRDATELGQTQVRLQKQVVDTQFQDKAALQASNDVSIEILALQKEQAALELKMADQGAARKGLIRQQVGLTSMGPGRFVDTKVMSIQAGVDEGTYKAQQAAVTAQQAATGEDTAQQGILARAKARLAVALRLNTVASNEATGALTEEAGAAAGAGRAATQEAGVAAGTAAEETAGLTRGLGGMVAALDPLTIGLLALPFAFTALSGAADSVKTQIDKIIKDAKKPITDLASLQASAKAAQAEATKLKQIKTDPGSLFGPSLFTQIGNDLGLGGGKDTPTPPSATPVRNPGSNYYQGYDNSSAAARLRAQEAAQRVAQQRQAQLARESTPQARATAKDHYATAWSQLATRGTEDARAVKNNTSSRDRFYKELNALKLDFKVTTMLNPDPKDSVPAIRAFNNAIQALYAKKQAQFNALNQKSGSNIFAGFSQFTPPQLEKQLTYADDYSRAFNMGQGGDSGIKRAIAAYQYLADKVGKSGPNSADLQALGQAQTNLNSTMSSMVSKLVADAKSAPTSGQANADLSKAYQLIETERRQVERALAAVIAEDKGNRQAIARAKAIADAQLQQINAQFDTVVQASAAMLADQSSLAQSKVTGSSPAADIARQQINLSYLQQGLRDAQRAGGGGDPGGRLQAGINNAQNALAKAQSDNARAITDAQSKLATSSITGISPAADIARAQSAVSAAATMLAYDQSHGAGQAQILSDQAALYDSQRALNQSIQQRDQQIAQDAQALLAAQAGFLESQTLDPIKQAREAMAADIKSLALIKPSDYTTQSQYQTAILNQKAKINNDRTSLNDKIVQQDLSTLKFELSTQKIGDQQYINALQNILKNKKLTLQERQQVQQDIFSTQQGLGANMDLNVGKIKLPSVYEIKRAIGMGQHGVMPGGSGTVINHTASVVVNVYGPKGASAVGVVLDHHLGTSVNSSMRAKGVG